MPVAIYNLPNSSINNFPEISDGSSSAISTLKASKYLCCKTFGIYEIAYFCTERNPYIQQKVKNILVSLYFSDISNFYKIQRNISNFVIFCTEL